MRPLGHSSESSPSSSRASQISVATITGGSGSDVTQLPVSILTPSCRALASSRSTRALQPPIT